MSVYDHLIDGNRYCNMVMLSGANSTLDFYHLDFWLGDLNE